MPAGSKIGWADLDKRWSLPRRIAAAVPVFFSTLRRQDAGWVHPRPLAPGIDLHYQWRSERKRVNPVQPYAHARASARLGRRDWREDLPIHEFLDVAKHGCPDLRHRAVLHNFDLGPELAARAFPARPEAREVARLHVRQDLRRLPALADWMGHCEVARLPRYRDPARVGPAIVARAADHLGLAEPEPVQAVWDMLTLPASFAPAYGDAANALLMNGIGPIVARSVFGPPRAFPRRGGGEAIVDFGWVCEGMIVASARHVPALTRILDCFDGREPE